MINMKLYRKYVHTKGIFNILALMGVAHGTTVARSRSTWLTSDKCESGPSLKARLRPFFGRTIFKTIYFPVTSVHIYNSHILQTQILIST